MNVQELINLIGFKLDKTSYNAVNDATIKIMDNMEGLARKASTFFTAPIIALAGAAIKLYSTEREAVAQVAQGLISTKNISQKTLQDLTQQAENFQRNTILGNDEILRQMTTQLLTFTNIAGASFDRSQRAILDISAKLDPTMNNLQSIAIQVGKALNDPIANLSALSRSGIQFSEQQKEMVERLWKSNKILEAQSIILTEIETQYGGTAQVLAKNSTGVKQFRNALSDLIELFGRDLFPVFKRFMDWITNITYKIQDFLTPTVRKTILIFSGFLAVIGPITLALFSLSKAGLFVNSILTMLGLGIVKSNAGILGTLGKYALLFSKISLIAGGIFLIFNEIYTYLKGGNTIIGQILPPWQELGPKLYSSIQPFIESIIKLWENFKVIAIDIINYFYDAFNSRTTEASLHFDNFIVHIGKMIGDLGKTLLPSLWKIYSSLVNGIVDLLAEIFVQGVVGFDNLLLSFEKSLWRWIKGMGIAIIDFIDEINIKFTNKLIDFASKIGIPKSILKTIQQNVDVEPRFGDWRNEPEGMSLSPVPYNRRKEAISSTKQINVTVNAGLNVPQGTPLQQQNYLERTVEELFSNNLNNLTRNLLQGLPGGN